MGVTTASAIRLGFCHSQRTTDGQIAPLTSADVLVNSNPTPLDLQVSQPTSSAPNAQGLHYYESPVRINVPVGTHTFVLRVSNSFGTGASVQYALEVRRESPTSPIRVRVIALPPGL